MKNLVTIAVVSFLFATWHTGVGAFELSHVSLDFDLSDLETRIAGGDLAVENQFPYQAGLYIEVVRGQFSWCGGSLIDKRWVLTAAHCVQGVLSVTIYLGSPDRLNPKEYIKVTSEIYIHDGYDSSSLENDIALVKLPNAVSYSDSIRAVNLPKRSSSQSLYVSHEAIATGWGRISDSTTAISNSLRYIIRPVIDNSECLKFYSYTLRSTNLCIDTTEGRSTCTGDSGGPLVLNESDQVVIGITSFGKSTGCTRGIPTVFTRVSSYLDWIEDISGVINK